MFLSKRSFPFCISLSIREDTDVTDAPAKREDAPDGSDGSTPDRAETPENPEVAELSTVSAPVARPATRPMAPRRLGGLKPMKPGSNGLNGPMVPQDWGGWKRQFLLYWSSAVNGDYRKFVFYMGTLYHIDRLYIDMIRMYVNIKAYFMWKICSVCWNLELLF